jgi:hypothetical protein
MASTRASKKLKKAKSIKHTKPLSLNSKTVCV